MKHKTSQAGFTLIELIAVMVMVVNLTVDMLYGVINPKIRKR